MLETRQLTKTWPFRGLCRLLPVYLVFSFGFTTFLLRFNHPKRNLKQLIFFGSIRTVHSYGFSRILTLMGIIGAYVIMAFAEPGKSDYIQFLWVVQYGTGISILENGMQFCSLFPNQMATLVGLANTALSASSIIPQLWLKEKISTDLTCP